MIRTGRYWKRNIFFWPAFDVRCADGGPNLPAAGGAGTAMPPSIFTADAERLGTRLKPAAAVRDARIAGNGRPAWLAVCGRVMTTGTNDAVIYFR